MLNECGPEVLSSLFGNQAASSRPRKMPIDAARVIEYRSNSSKRTAGVVISGRYYREAKIAAAWRPAAHNLRALPATSLRPTRTRSARTRDTSGSERRLLKLRECPAQRGVSVRAQRTHRLPHRGCGRGAQREDAIHGYGITCATGSPRRPRIAQRWSGAELCRREMTSRSNFRGRRRLRRVELEWQLHLERAAHHWVTTIFASLTSFFHWLTSLLIRSRNCSGGPPDGIMPSAASHFFTPSE